MKLQVQNLGPIRSGEIDLSKRFYVFVGYNNSGKTYMSQLLWGINQNIMHDFPNSNLLEQLMQNSLYWDVNIVHQKDKYIELFSDFLSKELLPQYFNSDKKNFENFSCSLIPKYPAETNFEEYFRDWLNFSIQLSRKDKQVFFLPANRIFYPTFYKYIYSVAKDEKDEIAKAIQRGKDIEKIKGFAKRPYTEMMDILTEKIYQFNFNGNATPTGHYTDLVEELTGIIGGKINLKSSLGIAPIEFSLELEKGEELDMHLASSSANQLTTLYLYLKYWAEEADNFLIIDEPEENLHPRNQIKLLDILMKFANQNQNKVLMTTHSPLLTDAVNNHLHLGYLKKHSKENLEKIIQENHLDIDIDAAMPHENIGIYFFNSKTIKEYEVEEYGAFFRDFRKEEKEITRTANVLMDYIYETNKNIKS